MIDFTQYTYQNLLQTMLDRVPDTYDKRDTAPIPTALGPTAFVMEGFISPWTRCSGRRLCRRPPDSLWMIWR